METIKHTPSFIMLDSELESLLLECPALLPNFIQLGGPIELLFHIYFRNNRDTDLIHQALLLGSQNQLPAPQLIQLHLARYGSEYLALLGQRMQARLGDKAKALRLIRRSTRYLPVSLNAFGQMLRRQASRRTNANRILIDEWILPDLRTRFPEHTAFIDSLGNWSDPEVRAELRMFIKHFFRNKSVDLAAESRSLRRTDSVTQIPHLLASSGSSSSSSGSTSSSSTTGSWRSATHSNSATPSPELSAFEHCRECCQEASTHQQLLQAWILQNRSQLKAWLFDGANFVSQDGILDETVKSTLMSEFSGQLDVLLSSPLLRHLRRKLAQEKIQLAQLASIDFASVKADSQSARSELVGSLRLRWTHSGHEIVKQ